MRAYNLIQVILLALVFSSSVYAQSAVEKKSTGKQSTLKVTKKPDKNQSQNPLDNKASSSSDKSSDDQSKTEKVEQPKNEVDSAIVEEKTEQSSQQKPITPKDEVSHRSNEPNLEQAQQTEPQIVRARTKGRLNDRDSGFAPQKGSWSFGLFNPLKVQLSDSWGIESHPLIALLISPHLKVWHKWWDKGPMTLQGLYGFTTPSWSLQKGVPFGLAGYLSPSCQVLEEEPTRAPLSCQRPGFDIVPQIGARLSGEQGDGVWTIEADVAIGLMITGQRPAPLDTYAPVDLVYAPTTNNFRSHLGLKYAHLVHRKVSVNIAADLYMIGQSDTQIMPKKSPLSMSTQLGIDWALGQQLSLTIGTILWLSDQRAFELIANDQGYVQKTSVK